MSSSDGHHPEYDANLLSTAPAPTKGMVQSGYATDLLEHKPNPTKPDDLEAARHNSLLRPNRPKSFVDGAEQPPTTFIRTKLSPSTDKTPFYRTTKGIVILIIVAVVLLAAIIGGAVGGSLAKKNKNIDPAQSAQGIPDPNHHSTSPTEASGDVGAPISTQTGSDGVGTSIVRFTTTVPPPGITPAPTVGAISSLTLTGFTGFT